jgi:hypothetical protein
MLSSTASLGCSLLKSHTLSRRARQRIQGVSSNRPKGLADKRAGVDSEHRAAGVFPKVSLDAVEMSDLRGPGAVLRFATLVTLRLVSMIV